MELHRLGWLAGSLFGSRPSYESETHRLLWRPNEIVVCPEKHKVNRYHSDWIVG